MFNKILIFLYSILTTDSTYLSFRNNQDKKQLLQVSGSPGNRYPRYRVTPGTPGTMYSKYHVLQVPCTPCTIYSRYHVFQVSKVLCSQGTQGTAQFLRVQGTLGGPGTRYFRYTRHQVHQAPGNLGTRYSRNQVLQVPGTLGTRNCRYHYFRYSRCSRYSRYSRYFRYFRYSRTLGIPGTPGAQGTPGTQGTIFTWYQAPRVIVIPGTRYSSY